MDIEHIVFPTTAPAQEREPRLGIIMPVWLQEKPVLEMTMQAVASICTKTPTDLYLVPTRLKTQLISERQLQHLAEMNCGRITTVLYTPGLERSVAGAWNEGLKTAIADGCEHLMIMANDVVLQLDTIDQLLEYGQRCPETDLWSAISTNGRGEIDAGTVSENPDYSCFMIRKEAVEKFGWFDEKFKPAYFEDSDSHARIVLGGGTAVCVHAAQMYHRGSMTVRLDKEAEHHSNYWFPINRERFRKKWGHEPVNDPAEMKRLYYQHPWNDPALPLSFWERD